MIKTNTPTKFVREYYDDASKKIASRWHYDHSITKNGPILVEEFGLPPKEKVKKNSNKVVSD